MNCPLCNKELACDKLYGRYWCLTKWKDPKYSAEGHHYFKDESITDLYIDKYRVIDYKDYIRIYQLNTNYNWLLIVQVPPFQIHSADQLARKIQTLIVFS
jgi:hypothetical protein